MVQPPTAWGPHPEPLAVDSAPLPEYGTGSLADLLPTLAAGMGVPGMTAAIPELTPADRNCVFLIDGLGWEQLKAHPDEAPFLTSLLAASRGGTGRPLTTGYPATTATSLASVGTGLPPGAHGLPGYTVRNPATGELMNQLRWQPWTEPGAWQPYPTVFELADRAGVPPPSRAVSAVRCASSEARYGVQAMGRCRSGGNCPMPATSRPSSRART
ncbi:hypothetical protein SGLAM104S_00076 [Streptomyces glaucescens]